MTSVNLFKEWRNSNLKVENVMLFVSDALRWDYLPESVAQRGITFKTVASSLFTASSFPSIVTGLYPYHHGIYSFLDMLPKGITTLLNLPGFNTSFWTENCWIDFEPPGSSQIHRILRFKNPVRLEELEPPFIYLEDEKGGHCPYGWTEGDIYKEYDCNKFFHDYGRKGVRELRRRYQMGIGRSVREFEKRIQILEERKLIDTTLIIFLSDHGELLGEYGGIVGHGNLTTPEVVYVPIVFIHPDLPGGRSFEKEGVLRHVDLFPTILDLLNIDVEMKADGVSLFNAEKLPDFGFTYWKTKSKKEGLFKSLLNFEIKEKSIWDKNGGYLFREGASLTLRLLRVIYNTTVSSNTESSYLKGKLRRIPIKMIKEYGNMLYFFCSRHITFGSPSFDIKKARELIKKVEESKVGEKDRLKREIDKLKMAGKI